MAAGQGLPPTARFTSGAMPRRRLSGRGFGPVTTPEPAFFY
ncbi:hypothetical protein [Hymenobacter sp. BT188]|nr:hypothetical protein [Hymenobacter sp. BT188]